MLRVILPSLNNKLTAATQYLTQNLAQEIDVRLMSPTGGFSIDQLMELAGALTAL